ncbi:MAG TPA: TonB family protein [Steroidobacteraceae bacterium]|nr:TonB family protein [Steroidobacteraceae bacterium]
MQVQVLVVVAATCCITQLQGCASSRFQPPHTRPDFPTSETFYPTNARIWGQEGVVTIHYCVDAEGRLSGTPSIKQSSGSEELDTAGLALAKAGDGHFQPAFDKGTATPGCNDLNARFELKEDPRFPTLSHRHKLLSAQFRPRFEALRKQAKQLLPLREHIDLLARVPGDQEQLARLKDYADNAEVVLKQLDALVSEFIAKLDELGRSEDVSETERTSFTKLWQTSRGRLKQEREAYLDLLSIMGAVEELVTYLQNAQPPLRGPARPIQPTPRQQAEIDAMISRARATYDTARVEVSALATAGQAGTEASAVTRPEETGPSTKKPAGSWIHLESILIADVPRPAASMPEVVLPKETGSMAEIPACHHSGAAAENFEGGLTILGLQIDATGAVSRAVVRRSSGSEQFDAAAAKCIAAVRFQPAMQGGKPVATVVEYGWKWRVDWDSGFSKTCGDLKSPGAVSSASSPPDRDPRPVAIVCTCFEESGKVRDPEIIQSSGSDRLDDGAIALARKGASRNPPRPPGHPGCSSFAMKFQLNDGSER